MHQATPATELPSRSSVVGCAVAFAGALGSGKTSLIASLARAAGTEPAKPHLLGVAATGVRHGEVSLCLLDTPGEPELAGAVATALRVADVLVLVVSAVDGLDSTGATLWAQAAAEGLPRLVAVTDIDDPRGDFDEAIAVCRRVLDDDLDEPRLLALYAPLLGEDAADTGDTGDTADVPDDVAGLLDLVTLEILDLTGAEPVTRPADPEHIEAVATAHDDVLHALMALTDDDDAVTDYLEGDPIDPAVLRAALATSVGEATLHPIVPVAAPSGVGATQLLDLLAGVPTSRFAPAVSTLDGDPVALPGLLAEVLAVAGDTCDVRLWSGSPASLGAQPCVTTSPDGVVTPVTVTSAVSLGGPVLRLQLAPPACVGATLTDETAGRLCEPWSLPEADTSMVISATDGPALRDALDRVLADDAVAVWEVVDDDVVLHCAGTRHAAAILSALAADGVAATARPTPTSLRVTPDGVLEPVDDVVIEVAAEYGVAVTDDVRRRRGRIADQSPVAGQRVRLAARVPQASLLHFSRDLRAVSHGTATFTRSYAGHEPMPSYLAARHRQPQPDPDRERPDLPLA